MGENQTFSKNRLKMDPSTNTSFSPRPTRPPEGQGYAKAVSMSQRIGWLRPSPSERRALLIEGIIVAAVVLVIGGLMLMVLG